MAQITYSSLRKFRYLGEDEYTPPETNEKNESIRLAAERQRQPIAATDCLQNARKFLSATREENILNHVKGLVKKEDFLAAEDKSRRDEALAACGLDALEMGRIVGSAREKESSLATQTALENIERKIDDRQKRIKKCEELKTFDTEYHPDHPIHSLSKLQGELFSKSKTVDNVSVAPACKKLKASKDNTSESVEMFDSPVKVFKEKPKSLWDMKERPIFQSKKRISTIPLEDKPLPSIENNKKTEDFSKSFIWPSVENPLTLDEIRSGVVSLDIIKSEPKFKDYNPGHLNSSSTLFVKNLSRDTRPVDLVSLFNRFEVEDKLPIEYRLLRGRMRGQAFVRFADEKTASDVMFHCNGYVLGGKPILLEYGRSK